MILIFPVAVTVSIPLVILFIVTKRRLDAYARLQASKIDNNDDFEEIVAEQQVEQVLVFDYLCFK